MEPTPPDEMTKQRWKEAERAFDRNAAAFNYHNGASENFAALTIKSLGLAAAGGLAASLGFYSANYEELRTIPGSLQAFNGTLGNLFMALFLSLLTAGMAYFSQLAYAHAADSMKLGYEFPYVARTEKSDKAVQIGHTFRWIGVEIALGSAAFLVMAGVRFSALL